MFGGDFEVGVYGYFIGFCWFEILVRGYIWWWMEVLVLGEVFLVVLVIFLFLFGS